MTFRRPVILEGIQEERRALLDHILLHEYIDDLKKIKLQVTFKLTECAI